MHFPRLILILEQKVISMNPSKIKSYYNRTVRTMGVRVQRQVVKISKKHQIKISKLDSYVKWNSEHILLMIFFYWRSSSCPILRFFVEMSIICGFDVRTYSKCSENRLFQTILSAEYNYMSFLKITTHNS